MIAVKASRRLRLHEDEQDSLLAGLNFQIHYLGSEEVLVDENNIDNVVEHVYSRYLTSAELCNSTVLAITVDTHQLAFFNVARNQTEFSIALPSIKSIHSGNKKKKFPKAITLVTILAGGKEKVHVLHCTSQGKAKELYDAINRAFEYHLPDDSLSEGQQEHVSRPRNNRVQPTDCDNKTTESTIERKNSPRETGKPRSRSEINSRRTGFNKIKNSFPKGESDLNEGQSSQNVDKTRTKVRTKSSGQTKGAEGLGLLENIDPEEEFDDEFTDFARSRSSSETTFKWFGR